MGPDLRITLDFGRAVAGLLIQIPTPLTRDFGFECAKSPQQALGFRVQGLGLRLKV